MELVIEDFIAKVIIFIIEKEQQIDIDLILIKNKYLIYKKIIKNNDYLL